MAIKTTGLYSGVGKPVDRRPLRPPGAERGQQKGAHTGRDRELELWSLFSLTPVETSSLHPPQQRSAHSVCDPVCRHDRSLVSAAVFEALKGTGSLPISGALWFLCSIKCIDGMACMYFLTYRTCVSLTQIPDGGDNDACARFLPRSSGSGHADRRTEAGTSGRQ